MIVTGKRVLKGRWVPRESKGVIRFRWAEFEVRREKFMGVAQLEYSSV